MAFRLNTWGVVSVMLAAVLAVVVFTAATIRVGGEGTRAVLSQMGWRRVGSEGGEGDGEEDSLPKLSYKGPLYAGDGNWVDPAGTVLHLSQPRKQQQLASMIHVKALPAGWAEARRKGLAFPPGSVSAEGSDVVGQLVGSMKRAAREANREARDAEGSLARGIKRGMKPVGRLLERGRTLGREISEGFSKALDVTDVAVSPKSPVKMLTHV